MDYYSTLGLKRGASNEDIKKAYRGMAMKHHPDRGGDEKRFKEIEEAYRTLSDPQKKQMIDSGIDPNAQPGRNFQDGGSPFEFHFGTDNLNDIFSNFGFTFGGRRMHRNRSFTINVTLTLEEVLKGKEVTAEIGIPGSEKKIVNISIPPGIEHGQNIRYQGMGDNTLRDAPPGDLIVNVNIQPHPKFRREGSNIIHDHKISVWDAILGTKLTVETLDGKKLDVMIPPGTQPETVLSCRNEGLPHLHNPSRGNLLIKISIDIPKGLSNNQLSMIQLIKNDERFK